MVNFPTRISNCDSHSPALLDLFISSELVFVLQWLSLHWEILIMLSSQFPSNFHHIHNGMPMFHCVAYDYSLVDWDGLRDHLRDVTWEDIFKLNTFSAAK